MHLDEFLVLIDTKNIQALLFSSPPRLFTEMTNEMKHFSFHHSLPLLRLPSHMFSSLTSHLDDGRGYSLIECVC